MEKLETIELKFLLKLLGFTGYRSKMSGMKLNNSTSAAQRDRICQALGAKGLVEYDIEVAQFVIAPPGKTLLNLDSTSLPVTPDELQVLKACQAQVATPGKIKKVPADMRQVLIRDLAARGMVNLKKETIKAVWLSVQGKQFLLRDYQPQGNALVATGTMLGNYVRFLRDMLGSADESAMAAPGAATATAISKVAISDITGSDITGSDITASTAVGTQPDANDVLAQIKQLDQMLVTDNYLPIYHLRQKLEPALSREALNRLLYALQSSEQIELSSLHDREGFSEAELAAGISQNNGGDLFFISVLN